MKKISERNKKLLQCLDSEDTTEVINVIKELKVEGDYRISQKMIDVLNENRNDEINKEAVLFLYDIKDPGSRFVFINAIKDQNYSGILYYLVSACWQTGLDFSEYLPVFVNLVINNDYLIAFESFTVIENMKGDFSRIQLDNETKKLKTAVLCANKDKQTLIVELIKVIQTLGIN
ncbi:MAG: hypothetical protein HY738_21995 [Bacteroidia bacterium]|nr:hypothetical protein [Bacteroidia bacterium]